MSCKILIYYRAKICMLLHGSCKTGILTYHLARFALACKKRAKIPCFVRFFSSKLVLETLDSNQVSILMVSKNITITKIKQIETFSLLFMHDHPCIVIFHPCIVDIFPRSWNESRHGEPMNNGLIMYKRRCKRG